MMSLVQTEKSILHTHFRFSRSFFYFHQHLFGHGDVTRKVLAGIVKKFAAFTVCV